MYRTYYFFGLGFGLGLGFVELTLIVRFFGAE